MKRDESIAELQRERLVAANSTFFLVKIVTKVLRQPKLTATLILQGGLQSTIHDAEQALAERGVEKKTAPVGTHGGSLDFTVQKLTEARAEELVKQGVTVIGMDFFAARRNNWDGKNEDD